MSNMPKRRTHQQYHKLIELLLDEWGAMSLNEIAAAMGFSVHWARKHVQHLTLEKVATLSRTIKRDRTFQGMDLGRSEKDRRLP